MKVCHFGKKKSTTNSYYAKALNKYLPLSCLVTTLGLRKWYLEVQCGYGVYYELKKVP